MIHVQIAAFAVLDDSAPMTLPPQAFAGPDTPRSVAVVVTPECALCEGEGDNANGVDGACPGCDGSGSGSDAEGSDLEECADCGESTAEGAPEPHTCPAGEPTPARTRADVLTRGADPATYRADIPPALARSAHHGTSFTPEKRGEQEIEGYASTLAADFAMLMKYATTPEKIATLDVEFTRYRQGYRQRYQTMLLAKSRCLSTMITGASNFPTRRANKASASADRRTGDVVDFRDAALARIKKALRPELRPVMSGDANAVERYEAKLAKLEKLQDATKEINATIRKHAKAGEDAQVAALVALGYGAKTAAEWLKPDFAGRIGIPDYVAKNRGAEIRRVKAKIAELTTAKATEDTTVEGEHAKLEDSTADNRVRLFFPGKPDKPTRERLKGNGFRWTPTLGCWQAYRNPNTLAIAKREAGIQESA